ncbi:hypothetical protein [Croceicoccus gelatinilyticus]|uniref:hypothetical protein n=1 Tax=Croceicoccus gelatinilyticus TaxID=2835536 RepID=UPI001BCF2DC7|nr:hypothetical protein [Croceicoccus gelatinilyticus]MBS7669317.1 hypothetical protein [Croceicoccus gelatinilyticus]
MSIIEDIETIGGNLLDEIKTEAKELAGSIVVYAKEMAGTALDMFVSYVKETKLGTAIMNLISAASSSGESGYVKFAAVITAAKDAWAAFVGAGGVSGVFAQFTSALVYVVQGLYERFTGKVA